jgi:hypothetical protein
MRAWLRKFLWWRKWLAPGDPQGGGENPDYGLRNPDENPDNGLPDPHGVDRGGGNPDSRGSRRERARRERARLERARVDRAKEALAAAAHEWSSTVACNQREGWSAKELARAFHRQLQADPDLAGCVVYQVWVESNYPVFCRWLRVASPPPYKDFARELAHVMPRKIKDERLGRGPDRVGSTSTVYCIGSRVAAGRKKASKASSQEGDGAELVDLQTVRAQRAAEPPQAAGDQVDRDAG